MTTQPRGIRNNNPGNIRWGDPWQGLVPVEERTDDDFCQFVDPTWGIRAIARTLITYQDKRRSFDGTVIDTLREIIHRWAPPNENDTEAYIEFASKVTGFDPDDVLDLHRYEDIKPVVEAIIRFECGVGPLKTQNTWYSDAAIDAALARAGVVQEAKQMAGVPLTKETVAATAVATVGVAQIAEVLSAIIDAAYEAEPYLASGSWVGIAGGVLTIAAAAFIAWAQVRKYQEGVVT